MEETIGERLLNTVIRVLERVPTPLLAAVLESLGSVAWAVDRRHRRYARINLGIAFPGIGDRDAFHIRVKAWTTGTLAVLFPISESFDYYLDAESLVPIRRDSLIRKTNRPEIVLYDQEKGTITTWYGDTMEVRKKKQIPPPGFYEGVSATYFFRTRGFGDRSVSIRLYGGRKVYLLSSERAGEETIPY